MMNSFKKSCAAISFAVAAFSASVSADVIAITGGTVHTLGKGGTIENGTVLIRDGKITAVGQNVSVPSDAKVIDASGQVVAPGFMHAASILGLSEVSAARSTNAHNASGSIYGASFNVEHGLNYRSLVIADNRRRGITHAMSGPSGADGLFHGSGLLVSLNSAPDMVLAKGPMLADINDGGNRSVAWAQLYQVFAEVKDFKRNRSSVMKGKGRTDYLLSTADMDALIPVVDGKQALALQLGGEVDIRKAIKFKKETGVELVLVGASEAWRVADDLAAAGIAVVIDAQDNRPTAFDEVWASRSNAAKLEKAGVKFAIADAGANHNASNIRQHAGIAVAHGLSWQAAMRSITAAPAEIYGLDDYGTLEAGKVANVVVWDGDPLQVTSNTTFVLVDGEDMPLVSRRTALRDKYLKQ